MEAILNNPHKVDTLAVFPYKEEMFHLDYITFAPPVELNEHMIYSQLQIVRQSDKAVMFNEKYPNYVSKQNIKRATKTITTNPSKFIK